jgi:hypothetical protein
MEFSTALSIAQVGVTVAVTDNTVAPPEEMVQHKSYWLSRNFTGTIVELAADHMIVQLPATDMGQPVFTVTPTMGLDITFPRPSLTTADKVARAKLDKDAQEVSIKTFRDFRGQVAVMMLWTEVQRLKLSNSTGNFAGLSALEKGKQFPTLWALSETYGTTIPNVATAVETRLFEQVKSLVLLEAKLLYAQDQIAAATTPEAKLAAAENVVWQ